MSGLFGRLFAPLFGTQSPEADAAPADGRIDPALWEATLARYPFLSALDADERQRLRRLSEAFLQEKAFAGAGGLELTDEICVAIAAQGCLPILNLGLAHYRGWHGVIVYPDEFVIPREVMDEAGVVHRYDEVASGEAWEGGPLILSWADVEMAGDGYNVVLHEFAHKLDMRNGATDGRPHLQKNQGDAGWDEVLHTAYDAFCAEVDRQLDAGVPEEAIDTLLDPYAAEHPAEFFAVASEVFFELPQAFQAEYPALYDQFSRYYRQDPAARRYETPREIKP